jgi:hypothetical protein
MEQNPQQKGKIVTLRVYRGELKRDFDDPTKVTSENQTIKLLHGILEWQIFLKTIRATYSRVAIEAVNEETITITDTGIKNLKGHPVIKRTTRYDKIDTPKEITAEIKKAMEGEAKELTPEQKELKVLNDKNKALEAEMAEIKALLKNGKGDDDLKVLKAEYKELNPTGKGVSPTWSKDQIQEKIDGFKAQ